MIDIPAPLRLRLDGDALVSNWRALDRMSGTAACGAAIKADGYGLGAEQVAIRLAAAGCRDFFVSNWREAAALAHLGLPLSVLHGVREEDMPAAVSLSGIARPVLNTPAQVARWKAADGGVCDVMVDTGMNRLGVSVEDVGSGLLHGLLIDTLMSHLACADEDSPKNEQQLTRFVALKGATISRRMSLANSAGIALGKRYAFDLTRPGLALYGGVPVPAMATSLTQVAMLEAEVLQRRTVDKGENVGYGVTWVAGSTTDVGVLNIGYADGYMRAFSNTGHACRQGCRLPVIGRVSMDLIAVNCTDTMVAEGEWVEIAFDLLAASAASSLSQYELLTQLGQRYERQWTDS